MFNYYAVLKIKREFTQYLESYFKLTKKTICSTKPDLCTNTFNLLKYSALGQKITGSNNYVKKENEHLSK